MFRRFWAGAACLLVTQAWGLDDASQKLADRYLAVLAANPTQTVAFDRLWKIYADAGETARLLDVVRAKKSEYPVLAARVLEKGGQGVEARALLEPLARQNRAAAELLIDWIELADGPQAAAERWAEWQLGDTDALLRLGELWTQAKNPDKAREAWRQAVVLAPHDLALRNRLAAALVAVGDLDEALVHWQVVVSEGSPQERLAVLEEIVRQARQAQRWDAAIAAQERLMAMLGAGHWKRAEAQRQLIELYRNADRLPELEARWIKEAEGANDSSAIQRLVSYYSVRQDETARRRWLQKAVEISPRDTALLGQLAKAELDAGHLSEAEEIVDQLQTLQPGDADTVFLHAEIAALRGEEDKAAGLVEEFLNARKGDEAAGLRAQDFYERMRLFHPLERSLEKAVAENPKDSDATVALVRFYLRQKRFADAVAALEKFPRPEFSRVAPQFANLLREAKLETDALRWFQRAWEANPSVETALPTAELLNALGRPDEALALVQSAAQLDALPDENTDRRLFAALQAYQPKDDVLNQGRGQIRAIIADLQKNAVAGETDETWLRLVRWRRWNDERIAAEESCLTGLKRFPQSQGLQSALADLLLAAGNIDGGIAALRQLAALAPDRANEIERRVGHLELDRARPEEAEKIFAAILQSHPTDWQAMADVAISQQTAGDWFEALETWMQAWQLAPPEGRRTLRSSILSATARLQLQPRGLAFLEQASLLERDPAARSELLRDAAIYAREQNVLESWQDILKKHLQEKDAPSFWREGLACAFREQGLFSEVKDTLAEDSETNDPEAWEFLLKAAEQEGDLVAAARWAERLARQGESSRAAAWMRYAALQERAGQWDQARTTWHTLVNRFARDPAVLLAAGDFFDRRGDRKSAEIFRRAATRLESPSPAILLKLGRSALARSDRDQAAKDFELLLASSQADRATYEHCLPWPLPESPPPGAVLPRDVRTGGFPRRSEWTIPSESDVEGCRLLAIKELARLLAHSPRKEAWLNSFTHPAERLWATYFSGETDEALRMVQDMKPVQEDAFVLLALQAGRGRTISSWANAELPRWAAAVAGLGFLLDQNWQPNAEVIREAFRLAPGIRLWEVCQQLAERRHYELASQLAEPVPAMLPDTLATQIYLEMAEWQVALRRPDRAREMLDRALEHGSPTVGFAKPFFSALHARWRLTAPHERVAFREAMTERVQGADPGAAASVRALLASLSDEHEQAQRELETAFAPASRTPGQNWVEVIQQGGARLEQWELHRLARDLYRTVLLRDRALTILRDEQFRHITEVNLLQSSLLTATPEFTRYLLAEWRSRKPSQEELLQSARRLLAAGQDQKAGEIITALCREDPSSDAVAMGLFSLTPQRHLAADLQGYVERVLNRPDSSPLSKSLAVQACMRLAGTAHQDGDYAKELALLEMLQGDAASAPAVVLSRSQALCRLGRPREALTLLEKASVTGDASSYAFALAELYSSLGREREASGILRRQLNANPQLRYTAAARLRDLATVLGDRDASAAALKVLGDSPVALADRSKTEANWPQALASLDQKYPSPADRFAAGTSFLLGQNQLPEPMRQQELQRLESIVRDSPDLSSRYYVFRTSLARQNDTLSAWEQELIPQWKSGSYFAGEILLQLYLEQNRLTDLEAVLDHYLTEPNFREIAWQQLARDFLQRGQNRLAEKVLVALRTRSDGDAERDLLLAEAIQKQNRSAESLIVPIETLIAVNPALRLSLARFYLAVNDPNRALGHLQQISRAEALDAEVAPIWEKLADQLLQAGRVEEARKALAESIRRGPSSDSAELVARYFRAVNQVPIPGEFALAPPDFCHAQALFAEDLLEKGQGDAVFSLFEKNPEMLGAVELRGVLQKIETTDWARTARIWDQVEDRPISWDVQAAAAQFHFRRAASLAKTEDLYLSELSVAHKLDPGNFALASALANELIRRGRTTQATRVLELAARSFGSVSDRLATRKMLDTLQLSPPLPKGG